MLISALVALSQTSAYTAEIDTRLVNHLVWMFTPQPSMILISHSVGEQQTGGRFIKQHGN